MKKEKNKSFMAFKINNSKNDEFYTPEYAIFPMLKFLKAKKYNTIWCPFDIKDSLYVKILKEEGFKVIYSHITDGQDFFKITPPQCDCILSNPPYSAKGAVLDRLFKIGTPFGMLVGVVGLFESEKRFSMFENNEFEILYFNRRVAFFRDYKNQKPASSPSQSSVYLCHKLLPKQVCFERINTSYKK